MGRRQVRGPSSRRRCWWQGAENEVPGFAARWPLNGFEVSQFTDYDDVGVFAQDCAEGVMEAFGVFPEFTLSDIAFYRLMNDFDGVFDGNNVIFAVFIDEIDEGIKCRGFAAAGRSGDQY